MTQTENILAHLQSGESITPRDALQLYGCFRLAARVKDLREAGHDIRTETESDGHKSYARYWLVRQRVEADGQMALNV